MALIRRRFRCRLCQALPLGPATGAENESTSTGPLRSLEAGASTPPGRTPPQGRTPPYSLAWGALTLGTAVIGVVSLAVWQFFRGPNPPDPVPPNRHGSCPVHLAVGHEHRPVPSTSLSAASAVLTHPKAPQPPSSISETTAPSTVRSTTDTAHPANCRVTASRKDSIVWLHCICDSIEIKPASLAISLPAEISIDTTVLRGLMTRSQAWARP